MTPTDIRARELLEKCDPAALANMLATAEGALRMYLEADEAVEQMDYFSFSVLDARAEVLAKSALTLIDDAAKGAQ